MLKEKDSKTMETQQLLTELSQEEHQQELPKWFYNRFIYLIFNFRFRHSDKLKLVSKPVETTPQRKH